MAPRPKIDPTCFKCKGDFTDDHPAATQYSAFHGECQPKRPHWWADIKGKKQAQCGACHELFTTVRTFDSHQALRDGTLVCKDPRRMFRRADHLRLLVLTERGWAKNPSLDGFNTFERKER